MNLPDRIANKIIPEPNSGCWLWLATLSDGYGRVYVHPSRVPKPAHRVVYELIKGKIPAGMDLDHLCRVRCCVNPDHLEAVSRKVNLNRGVNFHSSKKFCKNGHPFTEDNLYIYTLPNGNLTRACKACHKAHACRQRARK
jgi:hypothetical protein